MKKQFVFLMLVAGFMFACKPKVELEKPNVVTFPISEITETTAVAGGNVTSDGGAEVTARGVCWSLEKNPTIENNKTADGNGTGEFTSELTDLNDSTTYYVRAYAINSEGVSYGEEYSFVTLDVNDNDGENDGGDDNGDGDEEIVIELPSVVTVVVSEITETSAVCGGEVTSDGGAEVTSRGVCWSLSQNPTISDNHTSDGSGTGTFTSNIPNLVPNTQYYVKAYATNEKGTAYGEEVSFTTLEEIVIELPTVLTLPVSEITETSAVCGGEVTSDGGAAITSRGVCWSVNQNPTVTDFYAEEGEGLGSFTSNIPNLAPNTQYYVRAFAINSVGTSYGEEVSFTTLEVIEDEEGFINGYEYVDLGLPSGVRWATHNIGATAAHEKGDYFAWGEITTKSSFTEANCTSYGLNMEDISGNPQYDAARANWGSTWRVPTKEEFEELLNNCTWEWTVQNGIGCKKATGPNGNFIYLPISGYKYDSSIYMEDFGYYWNSTPISNYENFSYDFFFDQEYNLSMGFDDRCYGQTIRPVSD